MLQRLSILLLLTSACSSTPGLVDFTLLEAPVSIEAAEDAHQELSRLTSEHELNYDHPSFDTLVSIIDKLSQDRGGQPYQLYLLDAPEIANLRAIRGNHVYVWSGLLDLIQEESHLTALVAREMGLVHAGHTDRTVMDDIAELGVKVTTLTAAIAVAQFSGGAVVVANPGAVAKLVHEGAEMLIPHAGEWDFSETEESNAHGYSLHLLADAKLDPLLAREFWQKLDEDPELAKQLELIVRDLSPKEHLAIIDSHLPKALELYTARVPTDVFDWSRDVKEEEEPLMSLETDGQWVTEDYLKY